MDELTPYLEQLRRISSVMESLKKKDTATLQYHPLADAVYWSDEVPSDLGPEAEDALRFLLRYRTALLIGQPEDEWRCFWEVGKQAFPNWIGFSQARVTASKSVVEFYRRSAAEFDEVIDTYTESE